MTIDFYLYDRIFELNRNFTTEHVKIGKIPGFFSDFCSKLQVFFKISQIPGFFAYIVKFKVFSRIPGKVATL